MMPSGPREARINPSHLQSSPRRRPGSSFGRRSFRETLPHRLDDDERHRGIAGDLLVQHFEQQELICVRHKAWIVIIGKHQLHRVMELAQHIVERQMFVCSLFERVIVPGRSKEEAELVRISKEPLGDAPHGSQGSKFKTRPNGNHGKERSNCYSIGGFGDLGGLLGGVATTAAETAAGGGGSPSFISKVSIVFALVPTPKRI
jgi:hypothetical protein